MTPETLLLGAVLLGIAVLALLLLRLRPADAGAQGVLLGKVEALAAAQERQAERVAAQDKALSDGLAAVGERLSAQVLDQTRALGEALAQQNQRLAAAEKGLAEAIAAQNQTLVEALGAQGERVTKQLSDQARAAAESNAAIQERLAVIDAARANIESLGAQVTNLSSILGNKQRRGAFGEEQLEHIIRDRLPPEGFSFQHTLSNSRRADCFIHLPHPPGPIAVDSKFPLEAWVALRDATDDAQRQAGMRQFRLDVQKHVKDVAERYIIAGETAEGAIVFVPSEAIYAELHHSAAEVVTEAARRGVYIVSPTTLWAVLTSMRALMRDVRLRNEAGRIQKEVKALLADVGRLDSRVGELRKHFDNAQAAIGQIQISSDKIKRSGERIDAVEFGEAPELPAP